MRSYTEIIQTAFADGGMLDALLALQARDGYITEAALRELAAFVGVSPAELYDTASFYSMLRFTPPAKTVIRICRGTACHSGGNAELITALEAATGAKIGQLSADGKTYLGYVECLGQCQGAPNLLVNGKLFCNVDIGRLPELLSKGGMQE